MSNFEKLHNAILQEAQEKADAIAAKGQQEAEAILDEARQEATRLKVDGEREAIREGEELKERLNLTAQRSQQTRLLEAKHQQTGVVFEELKARIAAMAPREYREFLTRLVLKEELSPGDYELVIAEKDAGKIDAGFAKTLGSILKEKGVKLNFQGATARIGGGIVLKGEHLEENLSIDSLLKMHREELVQAAMDVLFPGDEE